MKNSTLEKKCSSCGKCFPATEEYFHRQKNGKYGLTSKCKTCKNFQIELWRLSNLEKHKSYKVKWRETNREKYLEVKRKNARKRKAKNHTSYSEEDVISLYGTTCYICSKEIDFTAPKSCRFDGWEQGLQIDHVIPLSLDGEDILENVRPTHGICNIKKSAKLLQQY